MSTLSSSATRHQVSPASPRPTRASPASAPPSFAHRHHTDAWSVLVATCDALDMTMAALTRIAGPITGETLAEQLAATDYEPGHGGLVRFGPDDFSGSDRFRLLRADPECMLDEWGCMRAVTDWLAPAADAPPPDSEVPQDQEDR